VYGVPGPSFQKSSSIPMLMEYIYSISVSTEIRITMIRQITHGFLPFCFPIFSNAIPMKKKQRAVLNFIEMKSGDTDVRRGI
jgi:hypothetical protein